MKAKITTKAKMGLRAPWLWLIILALCGLSTICMVNAIWCPTNCALGEVGRDANCSCWPNYMCPSAFGPWSMAHRMRPNGQVNCYHTVIDGSSHDWYYWNKNTSKWIPGASLATFATITERIVVQAECPYFECWIGATSKSGEISSYVWASPSESNTSTDYL